MTAQMLEIFIAKAYFSQHVPRRVAVGKQTRKNDVEQRLVREAETLPEDTVTFRLGPGDGLYIPPFAFHWVRGGPETSIAISCGFRTRTTEQANLVLGTLGG